MKIQVCNVLISLILIVVLHNTIYSQEFSINGNETNSISIENFKPDSDKITRILVHYMPWYQSLPISGYWGWHWTMDHFNPDNIDTNGHRDIASHYYPLTGPYDSRDDDILEYQVLLMKLSGVDGVIVDWYGIEDFWDYGIINESTKDLFDFVERAQLLFVITYEDQTIGHMVDNDHLSESRVYTHGQDVMLYLQNNWFTSDSYMKLSDKPVLLTFGPQYFFESSDWDILFSVLDVAPLFFTLDNRLTPVAEGAFPWPPMWASVDGILTNAALDNYLSGFYQTAESWNNSIASAFPGFHDIYSEAGLGFSFGYLDPQEGETFNNTLLTALKNDPDVIQIATWNDYGEGTIVEPTVEFGYRYLEMIQSVKRDSIDPSFPYTSKDLEIPIRIYNLRKMFNNDGIMNEILDSAFSLILTGDIQTAESLINSISVSIDDLSNGKINAVRPSLDFNYPNPFNPLTKIKFSLSGSGNVSLIIYDLLGREVTRLVDGHMTSGAYDIIWNASGVSSGIYFYRLRSGDFLETKKMILLK